jgi:predicted proteasome-type protease
MTYCVGLLLEQGLVFASDTRTNAGVDQVATSPKMHVFEVKNDRVVKYNTEMMDAVKCVLISFDSTIRSNVSVAAPIDMLLYRTDSLHANCKQHITESDTYYAEIRKGWGDGLKKVFSALPSPDWC